MGLLTRVLVAIAIWLFSAVDGHAQASCAANYLGGQNGACVGSTVCFTANGTSQQVIPQNTMRRFLLIQSTNPSDTVYYAIGNPPTNPAGPLLAVIGLDTQALVPAGNGTYPNFEVSALNSPASPPPRVPTGAVSIITAGTTDTVCIMEANG